MMPEHPQELSSTESLPRDGDRKASRYHLYNDIADFMVDLNERAGEIDDDALFQFAASYSHHFAESVQEAKNRNNGQGLDRYRLRLQ